MHLVLSRSPDGGKTWLPIQEVGVRKGWAYGIGSAVVDDTTGEVMVLYHSVPGTKAAKQEQKKENIATGRFIARSTDSGETWKHEELKITPNSKGKIGGCHGSAAGITLRFGPEKGRLLMPARFTTGGFSGHSEWSDEGIRVLQTCHFNCAIYSDDHGVTWKTSEPVQSGTGEGCLVERSDGTIYYNSRAYFFDAKRRSALGHDGGETFTDFAVEETLIEPNQGCNAAMIRVPRRLTPDQDTILLSNPANFPGRNTQWDPKMGRYKMTVHLSDDGGKRWPVSRTVNEGPSGYSSLAISADASQSIGRVEESWFALWKNGARLARRLT